MRAVLTMLLAVMLLTPGLRAQESRREQISAATSRAVEALRNQISQEPVGRNVTVGDVLAATNGAGTLRKTLCRAQMIGGPRWIDDQTCQVQLEMGGPRVAAALMQIVAANPEKSPIPADVLEVRLHDWDNRTFSAIGTSTGAAAAQNLRPVIDGVAWANVPDDARQQAIAAARQQAAHAAIDEIKPVALANGKTVGDVLAADAAVKSAIEKWIAARPVTQVEFRDDLQVRVTLATNSDELLDAIRDAGKKNDVLAQLDDATWTRVRNDFATAVSPTSRGSARAGEPVPGKAHALPAEAPSWINDQRSADGVGSEPRSPLKAARAAEAEAQDKLRAQIEMLPLARGLSIGDAAKQDARLNEAVDRAIVRARLSKPEYQANGSARVRATLDLGTLWEEISTNR